MQVLLSMSDLNCLFLIYHFSWRSVCKIYFCGEIPGYISHAVNILLGIWVA